MSRRRNFSSFLEAYQQFADDNYCPDQFHLWTGLSIIGAAVERKVWLRQTLEHASIMHYPNLYVLLVSYPAVGKTTAMDRGIDFLEHMREHVNPNFNIIPNQITESALLDQMMISQEIEIAGELRPHSSGFFYASEASASALQNLWGDFNATITALYDCPKWFRKKLKSEKEMKEIKNACFNMLAGCTFNYLKELINEKSVEGGLASRFIYVIARERKVRQSKWIDAESLRSKDSLDFEKRLLEDISQIHALTGRMRPTKGFIEQWEKAQPEFDRYLIGLNSSRLESLNARRFTNLMKVCMLLSVSEGDSLELTEDHWHRGQELIDVVSKDNAFVITSALVGDKESQNGINQAILTAIGDKEGDELPRTTVMRRLARYGGDAYRLEGSLKQLIQARMIDELPQSEGGSRLKLLINPEANL